MNRVLIFLSIILLFVLLAGGVYFFVLREAPKTETQNPTFGSGGNPINLPEDNTVDFIIENEAPIEKSELTQIHEAPVAGAHTYISEAEITVGSSTELVRTPLVQYVDKQTGHIFRYDLETLVAERVSNTTFPGIQEAYWFENENRTVLRYLNINNEIETYLGEVSNGSLTGSYLELDIPSTQTFEDTVLTVAPTDRGSDVFLTESDGRDGQLLFETKLGNILVPTFSETFVSILTKPVSSLAGVLFFYENGSLERVLGDKPGLTALPNKEGTYIVFSESTQNSFVTKLHDREENLTRTLPITTLPEKCVWGSETILYCMSPESIPIANYPEQWYQGFVSFSDALWRIDVDSGIARALAFFDKSGPFDGTHLSVNEDEEYLTFINRHDGSLWGFDL